MGQKNGLTVFHTTWMQRDYSRKRQFRSYSSGTRSAANHIVTSRFTASNYVHLYVQMLCDVLNADTLKKQQEQNFGDNSHRRPYRDSTVGGFQFLFQDPSLCSLASILTPNTFTSLDLQ